MTIKIISQKDYLVTEVNIALPSDLNELDTVMKAARGTGRIVATYQQGGVYGINLEQRTRIREGVADQVRKLVGVQTTEINGDDE
jgi:hypothetical protein